jgi:ribosome-associated protein
MVGEHIRILKEGRWIHAVDCGDETVLHLAEESPPPRVRRAYRPEFVAGATSVEVVTHRERTFPAKEIVKRAYSRASDPALASMFRDSEAFAEWCATGRLSGPRNVALDLGVAAPAPAPKAAPTAPAAQAKTVVPEPAAAKAAAPRKAKPAAAAKPKARAAARPAPRKKAAKAKRPAARAKSKGVKAARKPAARKAPARRGAKPARKTRR